MFEHFDEAARRAIFFARYEASNFAAREIETHHLLLGVLRAEPALETAVAGPESLREEFAPLRGDLKTAPVDIPLSRDVRRVLALAQEESRWEGGKYVTAVHLLAALTQDPGPAGEALRRRGIDLTVCREQILPMSSSSLRVELERLVDAVPDHRLGEAIAALEGLIRGEGAGAGAGAAGG
jgi:ATP-dependent Clp protease ATP-binding subunit ClpC